MKTKTPSVPTMITEDIDAPCPYCLTSQFVTLEHYQGSGWALHCHQCHTMSNKFHPSIASVEAEWDNLIIRRKYNDEI
jgi:hypothetical protein